MFARGSYRHGVPMTSLKRWAGRLWAGFDRAVAEVEDHDALAAAALRELERGLGRARSELEQLRAERQALQERRESELDRRRRGRSAAVAEPEDFLALEHLRTARRACERARRLEDRIREHAAAEDRMERHLTELADRLAESKRRYRALRARSERGLAVASVQDTRGEIDELFGRWEDVLPRIEPPGDPTEAAFDALERRDEEESLWTELHELRNGGHHAT